jgi:mono/diheme cytochrome c family protein
MKKVLFMGFTFFAVLVCTRCRHKQQNAYTDDTGHKLYDHYCAPCHLGTGQGGHTPGLGIPAPDIRKMTKSEAELQQIITNGFGKMPAFADSTSQQNITMIAKYAANEIEQHRPN